MRKLTSSLTVAAGAWLLMLVSSRCHCRAGTPNPSLNVPPKGFKALFNGRDLTGWKGLVANPKARAQMSPEQLAAMQAEADEQMRDSWKVVDGVLVFNGKGHNICTAKDYANFELLVDWKIEKGGDSGIYLRGSPQVQIWDRPDVGSGGLYNNKKGPSKPLAVADKPVGQWNTFRIIMVDERVTVCLNGILVVNGVVMENYWQRDKPIYPTGQIELQSHGSKLYFRNIFIREIPPIIRPEVPNTLTEQEKADGFRLLFNGKDLTGWQGGGPSYVVRDGTIAVEPARGGGGNLYTTEEYGDFIMRFEFKLTPGANNGLGIRTRMGVDAAYHGMELQILDNTAPKYKNLRPYQFHGSIYGVVPAKRGYLLPDAWNYEEVIARGNHIVVKLNGTTIVDADIRKAATPQTMDHRKHPGLFNEKGLICFCGHGDRLAFRNLRIKKLD